MFSRLSNLIAQAAEVTTHVLVGQQSREEELQGHWKTITHLISESDSETEPCMPEISTHLDRMADLLFKEEEDDNQLSMGPCMEFVIRHKLMDTLFATGKSDYPAGMRKVVFQFFSLLLGRIRQPLLPHIAVHRPINSLIKTCGLSFVNPLAVDEIQFLKTICFTLKTDPTLVNFFLEETDGQQKESIFTVAEALMRITNSEESLVCLKAFECLLFCVSLKNVSDLLAKSQFPLLLASKMRQHLQLLPSTLTYTDILNCKAGWGVNYASSTAIQCLSPSPRQPLLHLEAYLSWLDYFEQAIAAASEILQDCMCECIRKQVLEGVVLSKLSLSSEAELVIGLTLLTQSLRIMTYKRLIQEIIQFILTNAMDQLVQSCNHLNEDVCSASLLLLVTLFHLPALPHFLPLHYWEQYRNDIANKQHLEAIVKSYLNIVPSHLLSAHEVGGDSGLTHYLIEAHHQVSESRQLTTDTYTLTATSSSRDNDHETILITGLLDRLERLLDQTYDLNLHLTSVLSRLATFPEMYPLFSIDHTPSRNVYTVLQKVSSQLQAHADRSPGLQLNIIEARRRLLGEETSDLLSMPNNELLEGAVILEEFSKELATILYAKYSTDFLTVSVSNDIVDLSPPPQ